MRWIVTGATGMLGTDVVASLESRQGDSVVSLDRAELDITDFSACASMTEGADVVVNCAAWTAVDDAEERFADAFDVNATGAANLARAATQTGARLVQISTDYVFDGSATSPYTALDVVRPVSAYGRSKAAGEWAVRAAGENHLVLRTAWLYGEHGPNFPRTIARLLAERGSVAVVDDQVGQPTWTLDVAELLVRLVDAGVPGGIYGATASGSASWYDFARAVAESGVPGTVTPTSSADFVRPAPRPAYSVLSHDALDRAGVAPIGPWQERWSVAADRVLGRSA